MKYFFSLIFSLAITNIIFSQESKIRLLDSKQLDENFALQIFELLIFNNTEGPICLKVSSSFGEKILSKDTIELGMFKNGDTIFYNLKISQENVQRGLNDYFYFPIVLNPRTCFSTILRVTRKLNVNYKPWIEFSYINQKEVNYCELQKQYWNNIRWDHQNNLKFHTRRISLPNLLN